LTDIDQKPNDQPTSRPGDGFVQSFARGLTVIRTFNADNPEQTLSEVAAAAGLTRAGARRILLTLIALGYVQAEGRQFRLTPKILDLGFSYLSSMPFWNLAEPVIEALVSNVHESSSAAVLDGNEIVYVVRVPTRKIMTVSLSIGSRLPAFWTSLGRVLLSGQSDDQILMLLEQTDFVQHTPRTLITPGSLLTEIRTVRKQGWALVDQELEDGLMSIAAPIVDRQGRTIAAINISGNVQRKTAAEMQETFLPPLLAASQKISNLLKKR